MKSALLKWGKLVLVAGLMAWVFLTQVTWRDALEYRPGGAPDAEPQRTEYGAIVGPWNVEEVAFRDDDRTTPRTVRRGPQADGLELKVVPGLPTYWRNTDGFLFALGALCYLLTQLIAGARWWWLLRVNGMDVSLGGALRLTWIGTFFNNVVPGQTGGDLIKAIYVMKRYPDHRVPALVSVIVDRVLGLASLAVLGAVVVLFALDRYGMLAAAIWGVMLAVALLAVVAFSKRLRQRVKLSALLAKLPPRVGNVLRLVDQAVFFYRSHKKVIAASVLAGIVNHIVSVGSVVLIGEALGVGLPPFEYFVLIPIINIVSAVPIAPNGWGVGEAMYGFLFGTYGAPYLDVPDAEQTMATRGVALSVLYRLHLIGWSLLGGLLVLTGKDRVTRAEIDSEVDRENRGDGDGDDGPSAGAGTAGTPSGASSPSSATTASAPHGP